MKKAVFDTIKTGSFLIGFSNSILKYSGALMKLKIL